MEFYWDEIDEHCYVLYCKQSLYPLLNLFWDEDSCVYVCDSDFFGYSNEYDPDYYEFEYEEELQEIVKRDLIENITLKVRYMLEWINGINNL